MSLTMILEKVKTISSEFWKLGLFIAFLIGCLTFYKTFTYKYNAVETITVVGGAEKEFESDLIKWSGSYSRNNINIKEAYTLLKEDEKNIRTYLISKGIKENEMVFNSVSIDKQFDRRYGENGSLISETFSGYNLTQMVTVESKDIVKVEKLSREVTDLLERGIEFNSSNPYYFYTKLKDLKIDLLKTAAEDGHIRAKTVASHSGAWLGGLKKASVGIFQITGQNSNEDYTYGGAFNTTDRLKKASITIRQEYGVR